MIRQAISCDICGAEKKQTNHWFVAWEQGDELRVSGWNSRNRLRAGSKHLCGQACLHKLADDFMARVIAQKAASKMAAAGEMEESAEAVVMPAASAGGVVSRGGSANPPRPGAGRSLSAASHSIRSGMDGSLTSSAVSMEEIESSARLLPARVELPRPAAGLATVGEHGQAGSPAMPPEEPPRFTTRTWHTQAWQRERERAQRAGERGPEIVARRMGGGD